MVCSTGGQSHPGHPFHGGQVGGVIAHQPGDGHGAVFCDHHHGGQRWVVCHQWGDEPGGPNSAVGLGVALFRRTAMG
jgi:hypothetical protein